MPLKRKRRAGATATPEMATLDVDFFRLSSPSVRSPSLPEVGDAARAETHLQDSMAKEPAGSKTEAEEGMPGKPKFSLSPHIHQMQQAVAAVPVESVDATLNGGSSGSGVSSRVCGGSSSSSSSSSSVAKRKRDENTPPPLRDASIDVVELLSDDSDASLECVAAPNSVCGADVGARGLGVSGVSTSGSYKEVGPKNPKPEKITIIYLTNIPTHPEGTYTLGRNETFEEFASSFDSYKTGGDAILKWNNITIQPQYEPDVLLGDDVETSELRFTITVPRPSSTGTSPPAEDSDTEESNFLITVNSREGPVRLRVSAATKIENIIEYVRNSKGIEYGAELRLKFDDEELDPACTVGDTEIEEDDAVDFFYC